MLLLSVFLPIELVTETAGALTAQIKLYDSAYVAITMRDEDLGLVDKKVAHMLATRKPSSIERRYLTLQSVAMIDGTLCVNGREMYTTSERCEDSVLSLIDQILQYS